MLFVRFSTATLMLMVAVLTSSAAEIAPWSFLHEWFSAGEANQDDIDRQDVEHSVYEDDSRAFLSSTSFCGSSSDPTGECMTFGRCLTSGGVPDLISTCSGFIGTTCCTYSYTCNAVMTTSVGVWQSKLYPATVAQTSDGFAECTLRVRPRADTCFVRVQFLDTVLTSATQDSCTSNFMTITGQAEGASGLICGTLTGYETRDVKRFGRSLDLNSIDDAEFNFGDGKDNKKVYSDLKQKYRQEDSIRNSSQLHNLKRQHAEKLKKNKLTNLKTDTERLSAPRDAFNFTELENLAVRTGALDSDQNVRLDTLCRGFDAVQRILEPVAGTASNKQYFGRMMAVSNVGIFSLCGAVLVKSKFALTAASCLARLGYDEDGYKSRVWFQTPENLANAVSYTDLWGRAGSIDVIRVIIHPMYDHHNFRYNLAVLELATAITTITPVALATSGQLYEGNAADEIGYGLQAVNTNPSTLYSAYRNQPRQSTGRVLANAGCQTLYQNNLPRTATYANNFITDDMICVSLNEPQVQVCEGDQGGPVITTVNGVDTLIGIIAGNYFDCIASPYFTYQMGGLPDVAVRITSVLDFLTATTSTLNYNTATSSGSLFLTLFNFLGSTSNGRQYQSQEW